MHYIHLSHFSYWTVLCQLVQFGEGKVAMTDHLRYKPSLPPAPRLGFCGVTIS